MGGGQEFENDLGFFAVWLSVYDYAVGRYIKIEFLLPPKPEHIRFLQSGFELALCVVKISEHGHQQSDYMPNLI